MRRKVFKDYAKTIPEMLMGWRMGSDLDALSDLPDGELRVDLLRGEARFEAAPVPLWVASELQAWLKRSVEEAGLSADVFDEAEIRAQLRKERRGKLVVLNWDIVTSLRSDEDIYRSHVTDVHRWHRGVSGNPDG